MWSTTIGMVLMVMGFTAALGPVLFGLHLALVDERERRANGAMSQAAEDDVTLCPFCAEVVRGSELVHSNHELVLAAS